MAIRNVIIELKHSRNVSAAALEMAESPDGAFDVRVVPRVSGVNIDESFAPVAIPSLVEIPGGEEPVDESARMEIDERPDHATYLVRGVMDDVNVESVTAAAESAEEVVGIYADVTIEEFITCIGTPAVGTDRNVEELLCVGRLKARGMTGKNVLVAIVDTGINLAHLRSKGKNPAFDPTKSWVPRPGLTPGSLPVGHGTMCAFDACIAAPDCTLIDIAVLLSQRQGGSAMEGLLSDAVRAYAHLLQVMRSVAMPGSRYRGLVVNNSWGMFQPAWDFPKGHPGNYSHNPNHPFNRIVGTLERAGADILFAAGNCGRECPDGRCGGNTTGGIYGANSHPQVISVAGADIHKNRVGYSTTGPGCLTRMKPDVTGYTHFKGSGVYPHDGGTSAATPVVAGVVAALRTAKPFRLAVPTSWPAVIRRYIQRTAVDRGSRGYDFDYGYGLINSCTLATLDADQLGGGQGDGGDGGGAPQDEPTTPPAVGSEQSLDLSGESFAAGLVPNFFRISPDASPGGNTLTIRGLPNGTRAISVWMTEWVPPNHPHAGAARFDTQSVQLFNNGTMCRVVFHLHWGRHLPAAAQVIFG